MPAPDLTERVRIEQAALELDWIVDRHGGETWISRADYRFVLIWSGTGVAIGATLVYAGVLSAAKTWVELGAGVGRWVLRELHALSPAPSPQIRSIDTWHPAAVPIGLVERVIALAERLEGYDATSMVGPMWIAHELRRMVRESHRGR